MGAEESKPDTEKVCDDPQVYRRAAAVVRRRRRRRRRRYQRVSAAAACMCLPRQWSLALTKSSRESRPRSSSAPLDVWRGTRPEPSSSAAVPNRSKAGAEPANRARAASGA